MIYFMSNILVRKTCLITSPAGAFINEADAAFSYKNFLMKYRNLPCHDLETFHVHSTVSK